MEKKKILNSYSIPLEQILPQTGNSIYDLVVLISKRALELAEGAPPLVEADKETKPVTLALSEIVVDKVGRAKE